MCDVPHWATIIFEDRISKPSEIDEILQSIYELSQIVNWSTHDICDQLTKQVVSNSMVHQRIIDEFGAMRGFRMAR